MRARVCILTETLLFVPFYFNLRLYPHSLLFFQNWAHLSALLINITDNRYTDVFLFAFVLLKFAHFCLHGVFCLQILTHVVCTTVFVLIYWRHLSSRMDTRRQLLQTKSAVRTKKRGQFVPTESTVQTKSKNLREKSNKQTKVLSDKNRRHKPHLRLLYILSAHCQQST